MTCMSACRARARPRRAVLVLTTTIYYHQERLRPSPRLLPAHLLAGAQQLRFIMADRAPEGGPGHTMAG